MVSCRNAVAGLHFFPIAAIFMALAALLLLGPPYCCIPAAAAAAPPPPNTIASLAETSGLTQLSLALNTVDGYLLKAFTNSSTAVTVFAPTDAVSGGGRDHQGSLWCTGLGIHRSGQLRCGGRWGR